MIFQNERIESIPVLDSREIDRSRKEEERR